MRDLETARIMLAAAERDLRALGHMDDSTVFAVEVFGFHAQQVAEKCLKAWLSLKGVQYPKTHSIRLLLALLEQVGEDVADLWELVGLTAFAVQFRYDAFELHGEPLDRAELLRQATLLHRTVEEMLPPAEAHP